MEVEVLGPAGLTARDVDADVFDQPVVALDLEAKKPETRERRLSAALARLRAPVKASGA